MAGEVNIDHVYEATGRINTAAGKLAAAEKQFQEAKISYEGHLARRDELSDALKEELKAGVLLAVQSGILESNDLKTK